MYDALAERKVAMRDSSPSRFEGVYVNVQRYRFEPGRNIRRSDVC
jgi:hypothetical protein